MHRVFKVQTLIAAEYENRKRYVGNIIFISVDTEIKFHIPPLTLNINRCKVLIQNGSLK